MPKGTKICLAAVIVIVLASTVLSVIFLRRKKPDDTARYAEILQDNKVIYTLDLSRETDRSFRIECENGWNEVTIKDGKICISDADCPDKTCVKTGYLRSEYLPIICLPHRLVIRLSEGGGDENK